MKKLILSFLIVSSVLLVMGCKQAGLTPNSGDTTATSPVFEVAVNGMNNVAGSRSIGLGECDSVYLTAFNTTTRQKIYLGMPVGSTASITDGIAKLVFDEERSAWKSGVLTFPTSGGVTLLAYGVEEGNHLYSAQADYADAAALTGTITMTAVAGYTIGGFGPAGGYIAYADTSTHEYLEVAPFGWSGTLGTTADPEASDGWGMRGIDIAGALGTAIGTGAANTEAILDDDLQGTSYNEVATVEIADPGTGYKVGDILTIVTIDGGTGAKLFVTSVFGGPTGPVTGISFTMDGSNSWTREAGYGYAEDGEVTTSGGSGTGCKVDITVKEIKNTAAQKVPKNLSINGKTDWFLPSQEELNAMYTNLGATNKGQFTAQYYWSSTALDVYNAYAQNMSTGEELDDTGILNNKNMRNVAGNTPGTYCVRPARYVVEPVDD